MHQTFCFGNPYDSCVVLLLFFSFFFLSSRFVLVASKCGNPSSKGWGNKTWGRARLLNPHHAHTILSLNCSLASDFRVKFIAWGRLRIITELFKKKKTSDCFSVPIERYCKPIWRWLILFTRSNLLLYPHCFACSGKSCFLLFVLLCFSCFGIH